MEAIIIKSLVTLEIDFIELMAINFSVIRMDGAMATMIGKGSMETMSHYSLET